MTKRVLFVAWAPFFSGAERALLLTLGSLDPNRYEPFVLAGTDGEFASQVRAMGIPCEVASLLPLDKSRPVAGLLSIAAVLKAAARRRISLIHTNEAPSFQPAGYAARVLRVPIVTHVRFPVSAAGYRWMLRPDFSYSLFVSHALRTQAMTETPGFFDERSDVLYDGVEGQPVWSRPELERVRQELQLPLDRPIVAMAGQVAEVKGIWDFVEAARLMSLTNDDPFFVVLGDDLKTGGQTRRAMEERVAALGLRERFRFLGFRTDAPRLVQAFDVIAVPSHVEPLGNATLEAMAAGRPVVGSRVGGIPEMIVDGKTGRLVPPQDPRALCEALLSLAGDAPLRTRLGAAARERATVTFSVEAHGGRLQQTYDSLCSAGARPRSRKAAA